MFFIVPPSATNSSHFKKKGMRSITTLSNLEVCLISSNDAKWKTCDAAQHLKELKPAKALILRRNESQTVNFSSFFSFAAFLSTSVNI